MAENRYSKGIKAQKATEQPQPEDTKKVEAVEEQTETETPVEQKSSGRKPKKETTAIQDLAKTIGKSKKPKSSSHTIYLEDEVFKNLTKVAKNQEMTVSGFLNEMLKELLKELV